MRSLLLVSFLLSVIMDIAASQKPNETSLVIAQSDGTFRVSFEVIQKGKADGKGNFFLSTLYPDNVSNRVGRYIYYAVTMGDFTDYLIPAVRSISPYVTYSPHDVLDGGVRKDRTQTRAHTYSPISPLDDLFDGTSIDIPNGGPTIYGGSPAGFVQNGNRNVLNAWGKTGCCFLHANDTFAWGRRYRIVAHNLSIDYVYLRMVNAPKFHYFGQKIGIKAAVTDVFGLSTVPETQCNWILIRDDISKPFTAQGSTLSIQLPKVEKSDEVSFTLNASMINSASKKFWTPRGATTRQITFKLPLFHDLVGNSTLLDYNAPVTRMLRYQNPHDATDVLGGEYFDESASFFKPIDDDKLYPRNGQYMNATNDDVSDIAQTFTWVWEGVSSNNGLFGGNVTRPLSYQFFAFAFHNPIEQAIGTVTVCPVDVTCIVYINGSQPIGDDKYEVGWHQVIVRLSSEDPISASDGFKISFEASGLVTNDALMDVVPHKPHEVKTTSVMSTSVMSTTVKTTSFNSTTVKTTTVMSTSSADHKTDDSSKSDKSNKTGIIVGCVVGAIVLIGLIVLTIFLLKRRAIVNEDKKVGSVL